jgi:hypothetical protein
MSKVNVGGIHTPRHFNVQLSEGNSHTHISCKAQNNGDLEECNQKGFCVSLVHDWHEKEQPHISCVVIQAAMFAHLIELTCRRNFACSRLVLHCFLPLFIALSGGNLQVEKSWSKVPPLSMLPFLSAGIYDEPKFDSECAVQKSLTKTGEPCEPRFSDLAASFNTAPIVRGTRSASPRLRLGLPEVSLRTTPSNNTAPEQIPPSPPQLPPEPSLHTEFRSTAAPARRSNMCRFTGGCRRRAVFGEPSGPRDAPGASRGGAIFCAQHRRPTDRDVSNWACDHPSGCRRPAYYGTAGASQRFCGAHRIPAHVNLRSELQPAVERPRLRWEG